MNETWLSTTIIFAELGGVLLVAMLIWLIMFLVKLRKDGQRTRELIVFIKDMLESHKIKLKEHYKVLNLEENKSDSNINSLINDEKKLYEHLVSASISRDTSNLKLTVNDINRLLNDYLRLLTLQVDVTEDKKRDARELQLRKENEALRAQLASTEAKLKITTDTVESMMAEYATMYEGGKKEGEQRVKNEMYKLKQAMESEKAKAISAIKEAHEKEHEDD